MSTTICKWKEGVQFKCFQFWNCILCVILDAAAEREHFFVPCCLSTTKLIKQVRLVTFEFFDRWSFGSSDIHSSQRLYSSLQQIFKLSEFSWKVPGDLKKNKKTVVALIVDYIKCKRKMDLSALQLIILNILFFLYIWYWIAQSTSLFQRYKLLLAF